MCPKSFFVVILKLKNLKIFTSDSIFRCKKWRRTSLKKYNFLVFGKKINNKNGPTENSGKYFRLYYACPKFLQFIFWGFSGLLNPNLAFKFLIFWNSRWWIILSISRAPFWINHLEFGKLILFSEILILWCSKLQRKSFLKIQLLVLDLYRTYFWWKKIKKTRQKILKNTSEYAIDVNKLTFWYSK